MENQEGNIKAEFVNDQNQYIQQPSVYGVPLSGQPVVGQPIYPQCQKIEQLQSNQNLQNGYAYTQFPQIIQNANQGYQQILVIPNTLIVEQPQHLNPVSESTDNLPYYSRYFNGCNCYFGFLASVILIFRCVASFDEGADGAADNNVAAGILFILSYSSQYTREFFFIIGSCCGLRSLNNYSERFIRLYLIFIGFAFIFELIGSIIIIISYKKKGDEIAQRNNDSSGEQIFNNAILIFFIVTFIILTIYYGIFIRYAIKIRIMMIRLNVTQENGQNLQSQQPQVSQQN